MSKVKISRNNLRLQRKRRIRSKVSGTVEKPRLTVFKSIMNIKVQVIDDAKGLTLVAADLKEAKAKNTIEGAKAVGILAAKKCLAKNISSIIFDRSGYKYHGKIKALAEGAREGGLKF